MLALKSVLPDLPMIAGLSANHLAALEFSSSSRRLYIARDNDAAGLRAANRLHDRGAAKHVIRPDDDLRTRKQIGQAFGARSKSRSACFSWRCRRGS